MINMHQLSYAYAGKAATLQNLDCQWQAGRITGLLGLNGIGKTTLLKLLAGWLHAPEGSLQVAGFEPKQRQQAFLQQSYFLPEQGEALQCKGEVFKALHAPLYPNFDEQVWQQAVATFELDLSQKLSSLSAGWLKKFHIAFAFATKARVLLLDEPTNALDIPGKEQFRKLLVSATDDSQCVIISTHQVRDLQQVIDSLWLLDQQGLMTLALEDHPTLESQSLEQIFQAFSEDRLAAQLLEAAQ